MIFQKVESVRPNRLLASFENASVAWRCKFVRKTLVLHLLDILFFCLSVIISESSFDIIVRLSSVCFGKEVQRISWILHILGPKGWSSSSVSELSMLDAWTSVDLSFLDPNCREFWLAFISDLGFVFLDALLFVLISSKLLQTCFPSLFSFSLFCHYSFLRSFRSTLGFLC